MVVEKRCSGCKWYTERTYCSRFPPVPIVSVFTDSYGCVESKASTRFPKVDEEDFCGEWEDCRMTETHL